MNMTGEHGARALLSKAARRERRPRSAVGATNAAGPGGGPSRKGGLLNNAAAMFRPVVAGITENVAAAGQRQGNRSTFCFSAALRPEAPTCEPPDADRVRAGRGWG